MTAILPSGKFADQHLDIPITEGVVLERHSDWTVATNVPHYCVQHSPTGYEFGFAGSGPADLALNIIHWFLLDLGYQGERTACFKGECFSLAYQVHQEFKRQFLAVLLEDAVRVVISYAHVKEWASMMIYQESLVRELQAEANARLN